MSLGLLVGVFFVCEKMHVKDRSSFLLIFAKNEYTNEYTNEDFKGISQFMLLISK